MCMGRGTIVIEFVCVCEGMGEELQRVWRVKFKF